MPVSSSAKKALRVDHRRHDENLIQKNAFKRAAKDVRKAVLEGVTEGVDTLFAQAQSALDRAAKNNTIHPNKAARLKSRLHKKMVAAVVAPVAKKKTTTKTTVKKAAAKKAPARKVAPKKEA